jgi:hypothetical protein
MMLARLLMALEKWLYDEADAGRDIAPAIERLLGESTSVAIAGLLIGVGCRHPALFKGPLLPLLTAPELYVWDSLYKRHEQSHLLIALFKEPPMVQQLVREWYSLPHRKVPLEGLAQEAMLTDARVAAELTAARVRWSARIDDQGEPTFLRFLIARMDPANWRERTNTDGSPYWVFEAPEALLKESQQAAQETNRSGFWLTMPMQCRRILRGEVQLPAEELEEFWQAMQSATELPPPGDLTEDGVIGAEDTECGIAAVLVLQHRDWLRQHPDREQWCLDTMLAAAAVRRRRQWFDSSESGTDWSWDAFCADALPGLWAEQPVEPLLRMAIARLAMNIHHTTIAKLFAAAAEHRVALGADFVRLQHLAIHIACFRVAGEVARNRGDEAGAQAAFAAVTAHLESFVDGTLPAEVPAWAELAVPPDGPARVRWAELDTGYVQTAYAWMPPLDEARDADERAAWICHWQESVTALVQRITHDIDPRDGEVEGTPDESEYALLNALPARIMQAQPGEARTLWEPILAQAQIARYWVESFVGDWFMIGLQDAPAPEAFVREWQAMLQYAQEAWSPDSPGRSYHLSELHRRLLGLDGIAGSRWSAEQAPVIAAMSQWYERWAASTLQRREDAAHFARFLSRPGAQPLLRDGLAWLAAAETPPRSAGYNDGYEDAVGELLDHVSREHGEVSPQHRKRGRCLPCAAAAPRRSAGPDRARAQLAPVFAPHPVGVPCAHLRASHPAGAVSPRSRCVPRPERRVTPSIRAASGGARACHKSSAWGNPSYETPRLRPAAGAHRARPRGVRVFYEELVVGERGRGRSCGCGGDHAHPPGRGRDRTRALLGLSLPARVAPTNSTPPARSEAAGSRTKPACTRRGRGDARRPPPPAQAPRRRGGSRTRQPCRERRARTSRPAHVLRPRPAAPRPPRGARDEAAPRTRPPGGRCRSRAASPACRAPARSARSRPSTARALRAPARPAPARRGRSR